MSDYRVSRVQRAMLEAMEAAGDGGAISELAIQEATGPAYRWLCSLDALVARDFAFREGFSAYNLTERGREALRRDRAKDHDRRENGDHPAGMREADTHG